MICAVHNHDVHKSEVDSLLETGQICHIVRDRIGISSQINIYSNNILYIVKDKELLGISNDLPIDHNSMYGVGLKQDVANINALNVLIDTTMLTENVNKLKIKIMVNISTNNRALGNRPGLSNFV